MKNLLLTLALSATVTFADAQGTIQFANNAGTRLRYFGVLPVQGQIFAGQYSFGVFAGLTADSLSSQPVGNLGTNTATPGLISSYPSPQAHQLPGFEPNTIAFIQIRGWESRFDSYSSAVQFGGWYGQTDVKPVVLGPATGPGTVIWSSGDLTKFQAINMVPEPSTIALGGVGLVGLLLLRRRR
jgi:hypothetical protein